MQTPDSWMPGPAMAASGGTSAASACASARTEVSITWSPTGRARRRSATGRRAVRGLSFRRWSQRWRRAGHLRIVEREGALDVRNGHAIGGVLRSGCARLRAGTRGDRSRSAAAGSSCPRRQRSTGSAPRTSKNCCVGASDWRRVGDTASLATIARARCESARPASSEPASVAAANSASAYGRAMVDSSAMASCRCVRAWPLDLRAGQQVRMHLRVDSRSRICSAPATASTATWSRKLSWRAAFPARHRLPARAIAQRSPSAVLAGGVDDRRRRLLGLRDDLAGLVAGLVHRACAICLFASRGSWCRVRRRQGRRRSSCCARRAP